MIKYLKIFRPLNLAIIIATFLVIWFTAVPRHYQDCTPSFLELFIAIIICTFIAAAGNLHNDYEDKKVDKINKPDKDFPFSNYTFWIIFSLLNSISIILSLIIFSFYQLSLLVLLPIFLLFIYNKHLQKIAIIGNIIIAFLSALTVTLAVIISGLQHTPGVFQNYTLLLIQCSFLITLSREIIKDCIDIKGDSENNYKTLPILTSVKIATFISSLITLSTIYIIYLFIENYTFTDKMMPTSLLIVLIIFLLSISILLFSKYKNKLKLSSSMLKLSMAFSLIILLFL